MAWWILCNFYMSAAIYWLSTPFSFYLCFIIWLIHISTFQKWGDNIFRKEITFLTVIAACLFIGSTLSRYYVIYSFCQECMINQLAGMFSFFLFCIKNSSSGMGSSFEFLFQFYVIEICWEFQLIFSAG